MGKKISLIALAIVAFGFASAARLKAGTEMLIDNSAPAPRYNYTPAPPPPVYYAPPPVRVVVYPAVAYYTPPVRVCAYQRVYVRHLCWPFRR